MTTLLAERIDALLPQTQCARCGYPACREYADAIVSDRADINQCPPGGAHGIAALARLLDRTPKPLNPANGCEEPPTVALIDEDTCIGCVKCIRACPVDAIVGAARRMHTIIADECTGCGLCLPPCPVDCIVLRPIADRPLTHAHIMARARHARMRFEARNVRLAAAVRRRSAAPHTTNAAPAAANPPITRTAVLAAIARGKARRATKETS
ncbi:MAG: RnfABCDGE type electron transport complex subunit B [Rhodanobacter sp.]|jgi:electron transport complex protein RnfB|nr:RnfABCDGE type electron transport complex subunit B [Rhodanobacter sp.]